MHRTIPQHLALVLALIAAGGLQAQQQDPAAGGAETEKAETAESEGAEVAAEKAGEPVFGPVRSLVQVRAVRRSYDPGAPWTPARTEAQWGSGIWLGRGRVLTDLELVRGGVAFEVRREGEDLARTARLEYAGFDRGLAILITTAGADAAPASGKRDDSDLLQLPLGRQPPPLGGEVRIYGYESAGAAAGPGFANSGQSAASRRLAVAAFRETLLASSDTDYRPALILQRASDGPGPGFRGGPLWFGGRLVGLYHHREASAGELYAIDAGQIAEFFQDIQDGRYHGAPRSGIHYDSLANPAYRRYVALQDANIGGVRIARIEAAAPARGLLQPGDILFEIAGRGVTAEGQVQLSEGRSLSLESSYRILRSLSDVREIPFRVLRQGRSETLRLEIPVDAEPYTGLAFRRARVQGPPPYFLGGGLVFQELNYELMHATPAGESPLLRYRYENWSRDEIAEARDRDVVLTARLPDPINSGAEQFTHSVVASVNGRRVRNLQDFALEWRETRDAHIVIEFLERRAPLVLPAGAELEAADGRVAERYAIQENGRVR